ncbi:MAG: phosphopantothenoylcysteine decarboxylase domain-containing protein [Planctomycetota bacterium]|jgi:phosphopantothenoylcysteine decarboxylase/phosphopantothenate--cysteine ligase
MHFLITAGGTREYIDPVRFVSNASSGRMGFALARAALRAGHKVTLITAPTTQRPPSGLKIIKVETAAEMFAAVKKHFGKCDCLVMAAAVSDYTPAKPAKSKIKRSGRGLTIKLKPTADILKWAGRQKKEGQVVIGFALEDKKLRERAERKLREKNLDMIIANTPAAIGSEKSTVQIKTLDSGWTKMESATKSAVARRIIRLAQRVCGWAG